MQVAISIQLATVHFHPCPVNEHGDSDPSLAAMVTMQVSDKAHSDKNDMMVQQPRLFKLNACQLSPAEQKLR